ncbi:MAG: hypothetical protein ACRCV3_02570 [Desulfovibrionaceae bacterium]
MNLQNIHKNMSILIVSLILLTFFFSNSLADTPPPVSAHRNPALDSVPSNQKQMPTSTELEQQNTPKKHIDDVPTTRGVADSKQKSPIDPYKLEADYTLKKNPATIPRNQRVPSSEPRTSTVKKIRKVIPQDTNIRTSSTQQTTTTKDTAEWQSSDYEFTKDRNIIYYPKDSKLKMISLQFFTEISTGGRTAAKVRQLLTKINTSLPVSPLIIGLQQLYTKQALYPLSEWNKETFESAIKKVSSHTPNATMGENLTILRKDIIDIPTPTRLILITDGESYNASTAAFDLKLFYAPDPRFPLHIISFADNNNMRASIEQIVKVHDGSQLFHGEDLLQDAAAFRAFMDQLFIK